MFGTSMVGARNLLYALLIITLLKISILAFEFMELKKAHKAWISVIVAIMVLSVGLIILFEN
jgi:hypothetical protein